MLIFNCKTRKWQEAEIQEISAEELKALEDAIEAAVQKQMEEEAKRQLTMEEVVRLTIAKTINSITIEDETALRMVEYNLLIFVPSEEKLLSPSENLVGTNGQQKELFLKW